MLLVGAGLMIRSFAALQAARPGFEAAELVTFQLALPQLRYPNPPDHVRFFEDLNGAHAKRSRASRASAPASRCP